MPYIENLERNQRIRSVSIAIATAFIIGALIWLTFWLWGAPGSAPAKPAANEKPIVPPKETLESVTAPQEAETQKESKPEAVPSPMPENVQQNLTTPQKEQPSSGAVPKNVMDSLNAK